MLVRYSQDSKGRPVKKAVIYTKEEHNIPLENVDPDALRIISRLRETGFDAYIVGGAVRDLIVGKTPKDFDIVTNAIPSRIKKLFHNSRIIGRRFRLVHVIYGQKIFEVSTFRSIADGTVGNSFGSIDEDVQRRDFSLNALYYDPLKEQIIDYIGGFKDIKNKVIKPVIPLSCIFSDDPVRMLRAIKYAATTGFNMPFTLRRKINKSAYLLAPVSPSRLTEEIIKIMNSGHAYEIVHYAMKTDIYMQIQPSASALIMEDKKFEKNYFSNLKELDSLVSEKADVRLGEKLMYFIYDFVASLTDWQKEVNNKPVIGELYNRTWTQCRNFVLPMNPPRTELEYAIRLSLKKLGVNIRIPKGAFCDSDKKIKKQGLIDSDDSSVESPVKKKRRSSHYRKVKNVQAVSEINL